VAAVAYSHTLCSPCSILPIGPGSPRLLRVSCIARNHAKPTLALVYIATESTAPQIQLMLPETMPPVSVA
jgi:hypothetical protein